MATLDKLAADKVGAKKKKDKGIGGAVASNEKIRGWVSYIK